MKKKKKNQNMDTKKSKIFVKRILPILTGVSFMGISTILIATSSGISTIFLPNKNLNQKFTFDNKTFNSSEELLTYAKEKYFQRTTINDNRFRWSIDEKGEKVYFNDPSLLREYISNKIIKSTALSSSKFSKDNSGIGEINPNDFSKLYFNKTEEELNKEIFRGKNNSIHLSEMSAKDSYLSIHEAYYFNNIYFRNIEELKVYLQTVYYGADGPGFVEINKQPKNIGIIGPDGIISSSINANDLFLSDNNLEKTLQSKKDFINHINNQSKKFIEFKNDSGEYFYANEKDLENPNADLLSSFNNPFYSKLYSNQGQGTFIVDLDKEDPNTLYGPYYSKTSSGYEGITDSSQWKKTPSDDPLIYQEQNSNILANLLNMILFEDENLETDSPLNIKYLNEAHILPLINKLKSEYNVVYSGWVEFSNNIKKGQKYNSFYGLPISYIYLLENLIEIEADQNIINQVKNVFVSITEYLDTAIKIIFPDKLLKITNPNAVNKDETLSFEKIFNFGSNDTDWNVDIQYFMTQVSTNFNQFIVGINIFSQATLNAMYNGGSLSYRSDFIKQLFNEQPDIFKIENAMEYETIWNIFSSSNMEIIRDEIGKKNINKLVIGKPINENFLDDLIIALSTTTSLFSNASKFLYDTEIKNINWWEDNLIDEYGLLSSFVDSHSNSTIEKIYKSKENLTWENFMLIKFINSVDKNRLNRIADFNNPGQITLNSNLKDIIKKISLEEYTKNFVIDPQVTNNLSIISKTVALVNAYWKSVEKGLYWIKSSETRENYKEQYEKISHVFKVNSTDNPEAAAKLANALSKIKVISSFTKAIPYVQIALLTIDLLIGIFVPKTEYNSYVFENADGNKFIWNGGQTITKFFGLVEVSKTTIDDIKLIKPENIVKARVKDELYFNGKRYAETKLNDLKKDQLKSILNGDFSNDNINIVYSLDNISTNNPSNVRNDNTFNQMGNINDLILLSRSVPTYNSLAQYIYNNIKSNWETGGEYHTARFIFANGKFSENNVEAVTLSIQEIITDIKTVKIALIPELINNKPKYINGNNEDDNSLAPYSLPSKSWSIEGERTNTTDNKYIIFDPNQTNESKSIITDAEAIENIRKLFFAHFDIHSKIVIENEIKTNNMFSELKSSIITNMIFQVKLSNNLAKYFFNESDAFKWLLSQKNFTLYSYETESQIYEFENKIFYSKDEFVNFVLENAIMEDK